MFKSSDGCLLAIIAEYPKAQAVAQEPRAPLESAIFWLVRTGAYLSSLCNLKIKKNYLFKKPHKNIRIVECRYGETWPRSSPPFGKACVQRKQINSPRPGSNQRPDKTASELEAQTKELTSQLIIWLFGTSTQWYLVYLEPPPPPPFIFSPGEEAGGEDDPDDLQHGKAEAD